MKSHINLSDVPHPSERLAERSFEMTKGGESDRNGARGHSYLSASAGRMRAADQDG